MKRENINYIVVGIFVLAMLAAFLVVLYQITGRTGPTDEYYVTYSNVTGIKYGTPVLYEGYQVGQVEKILPVHEGGKTRYHLTLSVKKDWQIPSDSVARIIASGLLSAITIDINEGMSTTMLATGDSIEGVEATNIFAAVNDVAADLRELSRESIRPLIDNLNRHAGTLVADFTNLTETSIRPMIDNINQKFSQEIIDDLNSLLVKLNDSADRLLNVLDTDNQQHLDQILVNLEAASNALNELLIRIEGTRITMDGVLLNIDNLVENNKENVHASISDLHKSLSAVSRNINAIVHHMEGSSRNIHELSRQIRENPGLILRGSPQPDEEKGSRE
jgi:phospholipid/cholesterol/gamma-HCH transport system substrate-binding protein